MKMRPWHVAVIVIGLASQGCTDQKAPSASTASTGGSSAVTGPASATTKPRFRSPSGGYVRGPSQQRVIVFVNGIFGDAVSTWRNGSTSAYWPDLIASDHDFDGADIYVYSFQSPTLAQAQDILELAGRMKDFLDTDSVVANHSEVVFLCHSMGGLVTRAYLLAAKTSPAKVPLIYFFATPTAGANTAGIGEHLSANPQLRDMQVLQQGGYLQTLREEWLQTSNDASLDYPDKIASCCAYELQDTWLFRVVDEVSATYLCNRETRAVMANHLDIVKPKDSTAEPYVFFKAAYQRRFSPTAMQVRAFLGEQGHGRVEALSRDIASFHAGSEEIVVRQVKATQQYVDVGCAEEKRGEIEAHADLRPGEEIVEVHPAIVNSNNLKSSSAVLVRLDRATATVSYRIQGLDRVLFNCPGGGHADVIVNFVISRKNAGPERYEVPRRNPG